MLSHNHFCALAVLHELISSEQLAGSLRGRMERAVYVPYIYTNNQNKWADSFLAANGYLGKCNVLVPLIFCQGF